MFKLIYFIFLVLYFEAWGAQPLAFSEGHREAMMAGIGSTNNCSPGQFVKNPAGLFCDEKISDSQSFGSANFSLRKITHSSSGIDDLNRSEVNPYPGTTLFSNSFFEENFVVGFYGLLNQFLFNKAVGINQSGLSGTGFVENTTSQVSLGGFYSGYSNDVYWGATLFMQQENENNRSYLKYSGMGESYSQYSEVRTVEQSLGSRIGIIKKMESIKYALALSFPSVSLSGEGKKTSTLTSTDGTFNENYLTGKLKTQDSWSLTAGYELSKESSVFGFDVGYFTRSRQNSNELEIDDLSSAGYDFGFSWQKILNSKMTFISGLKFTQSDLVNKEDSDIKINVLSTGLLRTYKSVELGTALSYHHYETETPAGNEVSKSRTRLQSLMFTFSSSFFY